MECEKLLKLMVLLCKISTTTNLDFGTNGFYLPMDGRSPVGEDRSGKGNNFTPKGFGGSVSLDNPIISGALAYSEYNSRWNSSRVGTRDDSNSSHLVLAVPLVGILMIFIILLKEVDQ